MMILHYKTKKALKQAKGKPLLYTETSMFSDEYLANGTFTGCNHPKRSWFAQVTMRDGLIHKVT